MISMIAKSNKADQFIPAMQISQPPQVIDLSEEPAEIAMVNPHTDEMQFQGVSLEDLDIGDRLGACRDGGKGFQGCNSRVFRVTLKRRKETSASSCPGIERGGKKAEQRLPEFDESTELTPRLAVRIVESTQHGDISEKNPVSTGSMVGGRADSLELPGRFGELRVVSASAYTPALQNPSCGKTPFAPGSGAKGSKEFPAGCQDQRQEFALKMALTYRGQDPSQIERHMASELSVLIGDRIPPHPNIIRGLHSFQDTVRKDLRPLLWAGLGPEAEDMLNPQTSFLVEPIFAAGSLQALLNKRRLRCRGPPLLRLLDLMRFVEQMLSAVEHLLAHGLAHNDIKPDNWLLRNDQRTLVLTDFGSCIDASCPPTRPASAPPQNLLTSPSTLEAAGAADGSVPSSSPSSRRVSVSLLLHRKGGVVDRDSVTCKTGDANGPGSRLLSDGPLSPKTSSDAAMRGVDAAGTARFAEGGGKQPGNQQQQQQQHDEPVGDRQRGAGDGEAGGDSSTPAESSLGAGGNGRVLDSREALPEHSHRENRASTELSFVFDDGAIKKSPSTAPGSPISDRQGSNEMSGRREQGDASPQQRKRRRACAGGIVDQDKTAGPEELVFPFSEYFTAGTPSCVAPELGQAWRERSVFDFRRSDVYSVGVCLYHMLDPGGSGDVVASVPGRDARGQHGESKGESEECSWEGAWPLPIYPHNRGGCPYEIAQMCWSLLQHNASRRSSASEGHSLAAWFVSRLVAAEEHGVQGGDGGAPTSTKTSLPVALQTRTTLTGAENGDGSCGKRRRFDTGDGDCGAASSPGRGAGDACGGSREEATIKDRDSDAVTDGDATSGSGCKRLGGKAPVVSSPEEEARMAISSKETHGQAAGEYVSDAVGNPGVRQKMNGNSDEHVTRPAAARGVGGASEAAPGGEPAPPAQKLDELVMCDRISHVREFFAGATPEELFEALVVRRWDVAAACDLVCMHGIPSEYDLGPRDETGAASTCRGDMERPSPTSTPSKASGRRDGLVIAGTPGNGHPSGDGCNGRGRGSTLPPLETRPWYGHIARDVRDRWRDFLTFGRGAGNGANHHVAVNGESGATGQRGGSSDSGGGRRSDLFQRMRDNTVFQGQFQSRGQGQSQSQGQGQFQMQLQANRYGQSQQQQQQQQQQHNHHHQYQWVSRELVPFQQSFQVQACSGAPWAGNGELGGGKVVASRSNGWRDARFGNVAPYQQAPHNHGHGVGGRNLAHGRRASDHLRRAERKPGWSSKSLQPVLPSPSKRPGEGDAGSGDRSRPGAEVVRDNVASSRGFPMHKEIELSSTSRKTSTEERSGAFNGGGEGTNGAAGGVQNAGSPGPSGPTQDAGVSRDPGHQSGSMVESSPETVDPMDIE